MKKKILKNVAILAFALFGLGIIGNNLSYAKDSVYHDPGDGGGDGGGNVAKDCYRSYMGGISMVIPCLNYNPNTIPRYQCGTPMPFTWPIGRVYCCWH